MIVPHYISLPIQIMAWIFLIWLARAAYLSNKQEEK